MIRPRTALVALLPVALHALAREADRGLGLVLRAEVEPAGVVGEVERAIAAGWPSALGRVVLWLVGGLAVWLLLARLRPRAAGAAWPAPVGPGASLFLPLLLRPALTLLALLSVAARPAYPYGFTLPVALTQDWALGQDLAALAVLVALCLPSVRLPGPRAQEVVLVSFLAYAVLAPDWALVWEGHPGNEPKYLRQAVALGQFLTFDAEGVSAPMEQLPVRPLSDRLPAAASAFARESWAMAAALARGEVGRDAIRATRITRQTVRGKDGGVYYVLAPGPSLLLAPALRVDRSLNHARGAPGRVAASVLLWCAFAALLVGALFRLVRDATGWPGVAATLALGFAVVPPFLFYSFQFYPEMLGALVLAVAFRALALRPESLARHPWLHGWLLATLPWLHQKFLPVWLALVATGVWVSLSSRRTRSPGGGGAPRHSEGGSGPADEPSALRADPAKPGQGESPAMRPDPSGPGRREWLRRITRIPTGLLVPTLVSLYLTALYNFAITGSVRPDALFLAWGPGGVTSTRVGQGVLGLLLDARYGIVPYVPVLMLAAGGLAVGGVRRFAMVLPAAVVYYLTVASADNWAGAVCNLGRYFMPMAPLAVALVGVALSFRRASAAPGPEASAAPGPEESTGRLAGPSSRGGTELVETTGSGEPFAAGHADPLSLTGGIPRGLLALFLMLAAWTAVVAVALWRDPHAANDSALLLAKSTYADGHMYTPDLFIRRWTDGAPGLWVRIAAWLFAIAATGGWVLWISSGKGRRGASPLATLAAVVAVVLGAALVLEGWPGRRQAPSFGNALAVPPQAAAPVPGQSGTPAPVLFLEGAARRRYDEAVLGPGEVVLVLRSAAPAPALTVTVGGEGGVLRVGGRPPLVLRPTGALVTVPFVPYHEVRGRDGRSVAFARARLAVQGEAVLRLDPDPVPPVAAPAPGEQMEPDGSPDR